MTIEIQRRTGDDEVYGLIHTGLFAARPAPAIANRFYFCTDTLVLYRDTSAAWVEVARGETTTRLAQLAERAHGSLTGIGAADHHARYTDVEAVAAAKTVKLDDFTAPDDTTDLDAAAAKHGLMPKVDKVKLNGIEAGADVTDAANVGALTGGLYGINVETLTGDKTLTPGTDKIYQYLDEGGAVRTITLDTAGAIAGDRFVIRHIGTYTEWRPLIVNQGAVELDWIHAGNIKAFIFDGTNWVASDTGTGENNDRKHNVGVGRRTDARSAGTAVGSSAKGYVYGVGIGYYADGAEYGVAIGRDTDTKLKRYSIALGYYSRCERYGETSVNIDAETDQENNVIQVRWAGETADATPVEIYCGGYGTERCLVRASSALAFRLTVVARDNVAGHVAMYTFEGIIKRDNANNTVMSVCNKTVVHEDDATWDCAVTADDANEALIITVTGDADNPVQWAAVLDGVETHF